MGGGGKARTAHVQRQLVGAAVPNPDQLKSYWRKVDARAMPLSREPAADAGALRARPGVLLHGIAAKGFPVAAPLSWTEVKRGVRSDAYSMSHPPRRRRSE